MVQTTARYPSLTWLLETMEAKGKGEKKVDVLGKWFGTNYFQKALKNQKLY